MRNLCLLDLTLADFDLHGLRDDTSFPITGGYWSVVLSDRT